MYSSIRQTIACLKKTDKKAVKRSLVQIYPLDLDHGPIELGHETVTLGRSSSCQIQIADDSVSRQHAEIRFRGDRCEIIDLGSTNGVSVNGVLGQRTTLCSGDRIQLGTRVYRFLADDDIESQYHETVYSMMTRDGLTGVYNKRYLTETLVREVPRCKRHSRPIALIMIDVDNFKSVNDKFGYLVGDQLLRELAQRMQNVLREDDVLARLGGEKFAILIVESDLEQSVEIADRCREAVRSTAVDTTVGPIDATISVGVAAPVSDHLGSPDELIADAIERLCEAKSSGSGRVVC